MCARDCCHLPSATHVTTQSWFFAADLHAGTPASPAVAFCISPATPARRSTTAYADVCRRLQTLTTTHLPSPHLPHTFTIHTRIWTATLHTRHHTMHTQYTHTHTHYAHTHTPHILPHIHAPHWNSHAYHACHYHWITLPPAHYSAYLPPVVLPLPRCLPATYLPAHLNPSRTAALFLAFLAHL